MRKALASAKKLVDCHMAVAGDEQQAGEADPLAGRAQVHGAQLALHEPCKRAVFPIICRLCDRSPPCGGAALFVS